MTRLRLPVRYAEPSILGIGSFDRNETRAVKGKRPHSIDAIDESAVCVKVARKSGAAFSTLGGFISNPKKVF